MSQAQDRFRMAFLEANAKLSDDRLESLAVTIEAHLAVASYGGDDDDDDEENGDVAVEDEAPAITEEPSAPAFQEEPTPDEIRKEYEYLVDSARAEFADQLDTAQSVFRKYPTLVRAAKLPPLLHAAYVREYNCEPGNMLVYSPVITRKKRAELMAKAREYARGQMLHAQGFSYDDRKELKAMGVSL